MNNTVTSLTNRGQNGRRFKIKLLCLFFSNRIQCLKKDAFLQTLFLYIFCVGKNICFGRIFTLFHMHCRHSVYFLSLITLETSLQFEKTNFSSLSNLNQLPESRWDIMSLSVTPLKRLQCVAADVGSKFDSTMRVLASPDKKLTFFLGWGSVGWGAIQFTLGFALCLKIYRPLLVKV